MKTLNTILSVLMVVALTACSGGGGGGGGGGGTPTGSATFDNISVVASSTQCFQNSKVVVNTVNELNSASSCTNAGGTWTATSDDYCRVNGKDFKLTAGGTATTDEQASCVAAGGTVVLAANSIIYYCSISSVPTCADIGGTDITVDALKGSLSSLSIISGNNTITANADDVQTVIYADSHELLDNITVNPVAITGKAIIGADWEYYFSMSYTVDYFQASTVQFSATSPLAISGNISVESQSVRIYYYDY